MAKQNTINLPKFRLLCSDLHIPRARVLGHLEMLWQTCHITGPIFRDDEEVEAAAEWDGGIGEFAKTLVKRRWLDVTEDGHLQIHDYQDHMPKWVRDRDRLRIMRDKKLQKATDCDGQRQESSKSDECVATEADSLKPKPKPKERDKEADPDKGGTGGDKPPSRVGPNRLSAILQPQVSREEYVKEAIRRIMRVSHEPGTYADWWRTVIGRMVDTDGLGTLEESISYAEDCANPGKRKTKDLGELKSPGGYIASKCKAWLARTGRTLPATPKGTKE